MRSPFKEKFGIPRQPSLCSIKSELVLEQPYSADGIEIGLDQFSHIWVLFLFHQNLEQGWKPTVRPPRLGGNKKLGVLATRSTFRPNGIGMSVVKLESVKRKEQSVVIEVTGLDLVDGTPIVDIKPYIAYSDAVNADSAYAESAPKPLLEVSFEPSALDSLKQLVEDHSEVKQQIIEILQQDPRPAYKQKSTDDKVYGIRLYHLNIRWQINNQVCQVTEITFHDN